MVKWLPPIEPPKDPKLHAIWRMYEEGRYISLKIHGKQVGVKP